MMKESWKEHPFREGTLVRKTRKVEDGHYEVAVVRHSWTKPGTVDLLFKEVEFRLFFDNQQEPEWSMQLLQEDAAEFFEQESVSEEEIALYCLEGYSVWSADVFYDAKDSSLIPEFLNDLNQETVSFETMKKLTENNK